MTTRWHTIYTEDTIPEQARSAVKLWFKSNPWKGNEEERSQKAVKCVANLCHALGLRLPRIMFAPWGMAPPDFNPQQDLLLHSLTVMHVLHEYRHYMQANIPELPIFNDDYEADAEAWAHSVFYLTNPKQFCKSVTDGKITTVTPDLLYPVDATDQRHRAPLSVEEVDTFDALAESLMDSLGEDESDHEFMDLLATIGEAPGGPVDETDDGDLPDD
jgi:hypothetical protein